MTNSVDNGGKDMAVRRSTVRSFSIIRVEVQEAMGEEVRLGK